jgi:dihydrofolate reductase
MRKFIVCNMMSLDGYIEGPGGDVMALPMDEFFDEHNLERLRAADTLVLGATTYLGFKGFWPPVADNPEVSPGAARNPDMVGVYREIGRRLNEMHKVVVSDSLTWDDTAPWTETTTIVRRADARQTVAELKSRQGKDVFTHGSATLWNDLLVAGLVDELYLMVGAAALGGGTPAFRAGPFPPLRLLDTRRREGSSNLLLRYEVLSPSARRTM